MKQALAFTLALTLALLINASNGCAPDPEQMATKPPGETEAAPLRFQVQRQGKFEAGYDHHVREILIITDTKTGHQYLAVTGAGCTELWVQNNGKTTATVEE